MREKGTQKLLIPPGFREEALDCKSPLPSMLTASDRRSFPELHHHPHPFLQAVSQLGQLWKGRYQKGDPIPYFNTLLLTPYLTSFPLSCCNNSSSCLKNSKCWLNSHWTCGIIRWIKHCNVSPHLQSLSFLIRPSGYQRKHLKYVSNHVSLTNTLQPTNKQETFNGSPYFQNIQLNSLTWN